MQCNMNMDLSKVCRSCMKEDASWDNKHYNQEDVEDMFCFCTNIKITEEDNLPRKFCYNCIAKIESSFTFITEAQKADLTLRNLISRTVTSIIVKPESDIENTIDKAGNSIKLTLPDYKISTSAVDYKTPKVYKKHSKTVQPNQNPNIQSSEIFSKQIKDEQKLTNDIKESEIKKDGCPVCTKTFTSKTWLKKHMQKSHINPEHVCTECGKSFGKKSELTKHIPSHSTERKYMCPKAGCGKRFKRRRQVKTHVETHNDVRPYVCDECGMRFKQKNVLKSHMRVHMAKQHLCFQCGCSFSQVGNLRAHMLIHSGEKPFSCGDCEFRSATLSNLRRHQRRHAGVDTHICGTCKKGFKDSSTLYRHTRTHTGELPYKCPECPGAFADSWKRKTHIMRIHGMALKDIPRLRRDGLPLT